MTWIERDLAKTLSEDQTSLIQILLGPRQSGKSSLLSFLAKNKITEISFDDLSLRNFAESDPTLFLQQFSAPLILDEVQYVPNIFLELKKIIDQLKKKKLFSSEKSSFQRLYQLTGSNIFLLKKEVRETLVGRASYYYLNTLSVREIVRSLPSTPLNQILFQGGIPELYANPKIKVVQYINDYNSNYLEKDIARGAGIEKIREFNQVLGLLASRVGQILNLSDIAKSSGVKSVTVKEWVSILEQTGIIYILSPYATNLNNRLIKTPKLYFFDNGIAVRLQGWSEVLPLIKSPQIGALFENLVVAEVLKFRQNHLAEWNLFFWRTKEGEEVDLIVEFQKGEFLAIEVKWSTHFQEIRPSKNLSLAFPGLKEMVVVTPDREKLETQVSDQCRQISIFYLAEFLERFL